MMIVLINADPPDPFIVFGVDPKTDKFVEVWTQDFIDAVELSLMFNTPTFTAKVYDCASGLFIKPGVLRIAQKLCTDFLIRKL